MLCWLRFKTCSESPTVEFTSLWCSNLLLSCYSAILLSTACHCQREPVKTGSRDTPDATLQVLDTLSDIAITWLCLVSCVLCPVSWVLCPVSCVLRLVSCVLWRLPLFLSSCDSLDFVFQQINVGLLYVEIL